MSNKQNFHKKLTYTLNFCHNFFLKSLYGNIIKIDTKYL